MRIFALLLLAAMPLLALGQTRDIGEVFPEMPFAVKPVENGSYTIAVDRPDALYECGERATFAITQLGEDGAPLNEGKAIVTFRKEKEDFLAEMIVDFAAANPTLVKMTLNEPGFIWCTVNNSENVYHPKPIAAAGFSATKIETATEEPPDFDEFWQRGIARAQAIPLDPIVTGVEFDHPLYDGFKVSLANIDDTRIYGFLSVPKGAKDGSCPIVVIVPGAGWGASRPDPSLFAHGKVMTLVMNVHSYDPDPTTIEESFRELSKRSAYAYQGAPDPEKYYYRRATLGINRAFEFIETIPQWDGENIGYFGSSQGGMYGLILGGLNPGKFKFIAANVPAMIEHTAHEVGRSPGWPRLLANTPPATRGMAPYFDVVNFARRVTDPITIGNGYIDVACGPSGIYAAFNLIPSPEKLMIGSPKMGHSFDPIFSAHIVKTMYEKFGITEWE